MAFSFRIASVLFLATLSGLVLRPALAERPNDILVSLHTSGVSPVDHATDGEYLYYITRGDSSSCGAVYAALDTGETPPILLHQFSKSDPAGCNPEHIDYFSNLAVDDFIIVTTEEGGALKLSPDGVVISQAMLPGGAVGSSAQAAAAPKRARASNPAGYLYVTTLSGTNGAIYRLNVGALGKLSGTTKIFTFPGGAGGSYPTAPAVVGPDGNLYGVTQDGGTTKPTLCQNAVNGCGVVYRLTPPASGTGAWHEDVLYTFQGGKDGSEPNSRLAFDQAGNLYGTTFLGGDLTSASAGHCVAVEYGVVFGCGTVFRLTKAATTPWKETVLYAFHGGADGAQPFGPVTLDSNGNVYGSTVAGGRVTAKACLSSVLRSQTPGCGIVFELVKGAGTSWTESVLFSFTGGKDGAQPAGLLNLDSAGNIFGTTMAGGDTTFFCGYAGGVAWAKGCGVIYELKNAP